MSDIELIVFILKGFAAFGLASLVLAFKPNPQTRRFIVCLVSSYMFVTFAKSLAQRTLGNLESVVNQTERERIEMTLKVEELADKLEEMANKTQYIEQDAASQVFQDELEYSEEDSAQESFEEEIDEMIDCVDLISIISTNLVEDSTNLLEITCFEKKDASLDFRAQWHEGVVDESDELGLIATTNMRFDVLGANHLIAKTQIPAMCNAVEFSLPRINLPEEWDVCGVEFKLLKLLDSDGDDILDYIETTRYHTDPNDPDSDHDGINDGDELLLGTEPNDPDSDDDNLLDGQELDYGSNPNSPYSKGVGAIDDYTAHALGLDPQEEDSDGDGIIDADEIRGRSSNNTNPLKWDSDGDGLSDGYERDISNTNPKLIDTDGDELTDYQEIYETFTDPTDDDSDDDSITDFDEWVIGSDASTRTTKSSLCTNLTVPDYSDSTGPIFEFSHDFDITVNYYDDRLTPDYAVFGLYAPTGGVTTASTLDFINIGSNAGRQNAFEMTITNGLFRALRTGLYRFRINADDWAKVYIDGEEIFDEFIPGEGEGIPCDYVEKLMVAGRDYQVSGLVTNLGGRAKLEFTNHVDFAEYERVKFTADFSKPFIMCDSFPNEALTPEKHTFLRISARGGDFGGRLTFDCRGMSKLNECEIEGLSCDVLPPYLDVLANTTTNLLVSYRGVTPSTSLEDIKIIATFTESETTYTSVSTAAVTVVTALMYADYDRDGDIDDNDKGSWTEGKKLRHWVNTTGGNDAMVDGVADLINFVPVKLDIKTLLDLLGDEVGKYKFKIEGPGGAVNCVWTSLDPSAANSFQYTECTIAGSSLNTAVSTAPVATTSEEMSTSFINHLRTCTDGGVFLIEGRSAARSPLTFACYRRIDDALVARVRMPMQISNVEDMYRWINLRPICGDLSGERTNRCVPDNFPDEESDDKHYVFVHGYNVSASSARNWGNELFKRLWQSGSKSMFTAVDWYGDFSAVQGEAINVPALNFYQNVIHAFESSKALKGFCQQMPGSKIMLGHSLGNMLVSSAIVDHELNYQKYFMLNAAVPIEAYDSSADVNEEMIDSAWPDILDWMRASRFSGLFADTNDFRRSVSWKGRFGLIPNAINCYSPTEDVLANPTLGGLGYVWSMQELFKGSKLWNIPNIAGLKVNIEGGWGINPRYAFNLDAYIPGLGFNALYFAPYTIEDVITRSLFTSFQNKQLHATNALNFVNYKLRSKLLADAIPAETFAAGANPIGNDFSNVNYLNHADNWPNLRNQVKIWKHSDIKDVPYFYVRQFIKEVILGGE